MPTPRGFSRTPWKRSPSCLGKFTPHLAVLALLTTSCTSPEPERPPPPNARHLVLVTIDTLRADRLGSYGNRELPTPNLDRLAAEGTMAPDAMVHTPLTRPSHFSLFSGLLPSQHGIRDNLAPPRGPETPLLAEVLQTAGFRTAGFVSSIVLASHTGLNRGFDTYSDEFEGGEDGEIHMATDLQKRGDETVQEAVSWLESGAEAEARLFAWIHLYDPHEPYDPPEPYASRYAERPYEGEIAWTDELVGRIDAALTRLGLRDQTLLTVTADHGEGMGEHREMTHGFFIYQSTLAVPLLFRGPGVVPGGRLPVTVRTIDLLPTLLELVGVPPPAGAALPGQSLAGALRGQDPPPEPLTYAETLEPRLRYGWSDLRSVREGRWKYIQAPRPELYDLENDPGERRNLAEVEPSRVKALQASLGRILADESTASDPGSPGASLPLDLREKLGALGYVGGSGAAGAADPGADPKDKIDDFKIATDLMQRGLVRLNEEDFAGSAELFQELLGRGVRSFELHFYLARALIALKRYEEAATEFEQAVDFEPGYPTGGRAWQTAVWRWATCGARSRPSGRVRSPARGRRVCAGARPDSGGGSASARRRDEPTSRPCPWRRTTPCCGCTTASCSATWERWRRRSAVYGKRWSSTPSPPPTGTLWAWSSVLTGGWPRPRRPSAGPGSATTPTRSTRSTLASLCCAWAARKKREGCSRRRSSWNRASRTLASAWPRSAPDALARARQHTHADLVADNPA